MSNARIEAIDRLRKTGQMKSVLRRMCAFCRFYKSKLELKSTSFGYACKSCRSLPKKPWKENILKLGESREMEGIEKLTSEIFQSIIQKPLDSDQSDHNTIPT